MFSSTVYIGNNTYAADILHYLRLQLIFPNKTTVFSKYSYNEYIILFIKTDHIVHGNIGCWRYSRDYNKLCQIQAILRCDPNTSNGYRISGSVYICQYVFISEYIYCGLVAAQDVILIDQQFLVGEGNVVHLTTFFNLFFYNSTALFPSRI